MKTRLALTLGASLAITGAAGAALADDRAAPEPPADPKPAPLAGYADGGFYLRDPHDNFRFYPRGRLYLDFNSFHGPGVSGVPASDGGTALAPRVLVRRARAEIAGDFYKRVSLLVSVDVGGQPITNIDGKAQTSASKAGDAPTASSARFAAVQTAAPSAALADVWINVRIFDELHFMVGQYQTPFSLENRIMEGNNPLMERAFPVRAFALQSPREMGVTAWGDIGGGAFDYEVGFFGGDGQNRPQVDARFDFFGRVFAHPFAHAGGMLRDVQIGASGHYGDRDSKAVGYDYTPITSGQGVVLWNPTYNDSLGRRTHVIPSGKQAAVGGELRIPIGRFDLRGEAYLVRNDTREAVSGYQLTNSERFGGVRGVGWYGQLSVWPYGTPFVVDDPGHTRPQTLDLDKPREAPKRGLEMLVIVSGVNASYNGASRKGTADAKTPNSDISIYNFGFGANFWLTRHFRFSVNHMVYYTPGSGTADNLAKVPGNMLQGPGKPAIAPVAHVLHEFGSRLAVQF